MRIKFQHVKHGQRFHRGKRNAGYPRTGVMWQEYIRESGNSCRCVAQINYGNTRGIDGIYAISPAERVFVIS